MKRVFFRELFLNLSDRPIIALFFSSLFYCFVRRNPNRQMRHLQIVQLLRG